MNWRRGVGSVGLGTAVALLLWFVWLAPVFGGAVAGYRHRDSPSVALGVGLLVGAVSMLLPAVYILVAALPDGISVEELWILTEFTGGAVAIGLLGGVGAGLTVAMTGSTGQQILRRLGIRVD